MIKATLALVAEQGLPAVTAERITHRSGVSWGGIQHQFGGKAAILNAVLERVLEDFGHKVSTFSTRATTVRGRVRAWVDASWELLRHPAYQAYRQVMQGTTALPELDAEDVLKRTESMLRPLREELFPEVPPSTLELMNAILFATLSGMAEQDRYSLVRPKLQRQQIATLRDTLARLAQGE